MEKEYLYEFAENALKEVLVDVTNKISEGYKVCGMEPMFRVANQNLRIDVYKRQHITGYSGQR